MTQHQPRVLQTGTIEFTGVVVKSSSDLTARPVQLSLDAQTWYDAEWVAAPPGALTARDRALGLTHAQVAQTLVGTVMQLPPPGSVGVYVTFANDPEAPILLAGSIEIQ